MLRNYFYDNQIRRFLQQFMRMFSNFQVMFLDTNGDPTLRQVPVVYGDPSRQAANVVSNNSASTVLTVPQIACTIEDLKYDRERLQDPTFVSTMTIRERHYNAETQRYTMNQGVDYNVQRMMPAPWQLTLKADIWTSSTDQKLQLVEQITTLFNPAFEVQSTDNYVDWTSLTYVEILDTNWTSRSVPIGTDNPIDILTFHFKMPIWLSAPVKVYQMGVIQKIIASIYQDDGTLNPDIIEGDNLLSRQYITPLQYSLILFNNQLTLMKPADVDLNANNLNPDEKLGTVDYWHNLINMYGSLNAGVSQIKLQQPDNRTEVIGTLAYNPLDDTKMIFDVVTNTLPTNDLAAINAVVDPTKSGPGEGLAAAVAGQRYMLLHDMGDTSTYHNPTIWGHTIANENDIIEYTGTEWIVSFNSQEVEGVHFVTNLTTGIQYVWDETQWQKSVDGYYSPGLWTIII